MKKGNSESKRRRENTYVFFFSLLIGIILCFQSVLAQENVFSLTESSSADLLGKSKNALLMVRFGDENEFVTEKQNKSTQNVIESLDLMYNTAEVSLKNYYLEQSIGKLQVETKIFPQNTSFQTYHNRSYYQPMTLSNLDGYVSHYRVLQATNENGDLLNQYRLMPEIQCSSTQNNLQYHLGVNDIENVSFLCPHIHVNYVYHENTEQYFLENAEIINAPSKHIWNEKELCIQSQEADLRENALIGECMVNLSKIAEQGEYSSTTFWFSGNTDKWTDILWPHQFQYINFGSTEEEVKKSLLYYMKLDVNNPLADQIFNFIKERFQDNGHSFAYLGLGKEDISYYKDPNNRVYHIMFEDYSNAYSIVTKDTNGSEVTIPSISSNCHEYAHVLGLPDYYTFSNLSLTTVGNWNLLGDPDRLFPQSFTIYDRWKLMGWIPDNTISEITVDGKYTLDTCSGPIDIEGKKLGYWIKNPASDSLYPEKIFMEYRTNTGLYEQKLYSSNNIFFNRPEGLLLYAVDEIAMRESKGNAYGPPFGEVVYRIEGQGEKIFGEEFYRNSLNSYSSFVTQSYITREWADAAASVLTNQPYYAPYLNQAIDLEATSYGNMNREKEVSFYEEDPTRTENMLISMRTKKNSGIVICDVEQEQGDSSKISFWVDIYPPEILSANISTKDQEQIVMVNFNEPIQKGGGNIFTIGNRSAMVDFIEWGKDFILIHIKNAGTDPYFIHIDADGVIDQVQRPMAGEKKISMNGAS